MGTRERHGLVFHSPASPSRDSNPSFLVQQDEALSLPNKSAQSQGHGAGPSRGGPDVQAVLGGFAVS